MKEIMRSLVLRVLPTLLIGGFFFSLFSETKAQKMEKVLEECSTILKSFQGRSVPHVPQYVLNHAKGLAIMKITEGGLIFSGRSGMGVVIARTNDGWSGPSCISTSGAGFGLQAGGKVTEVVFVINSSEVLDRFANGTKVEFKGVASAVAGPAPTEVTADFVPKHAIYSYLVQDGAFGGLAIDGGVFAQEKKTNARFYGVPVMPHEILSGRVKAPAGPTHAKVFNDLVNQYAPASKAVNGPYVKE